MQEPFFKQTWHWYRWYSCVWKREIWWIKLEGYTVQQFRHRIIQGKAVGHWLWRRRSPRGDHDYDYRRCLMETIYIFFFLFLMLNFSLSLGLVGVNLKKWYSWVQVILGFVSGFFVANNMVQGIVPGVLFAILMIWLGPIVWRRRQLWLYRLADIPYIKSVVSGIQRSPCRCATPHFPTPITAIPVNATWTPHGWTDGLQGAFLLALS